MLYAFIPARYASTRLPGKPLIKILGKTLLERVYEGVKQSKLVDKIIILTDDNRIKESAEKFLNDRDLVVMTPIELQSGTERIAYFLENNKRETENIDFILNIQGDEPLITAEIIDTISKITKKCTDQTPMATLYNVSNNKNSFFDKNTVKLVKDVEGNALYFSRAPIPHFKQEPQNIEFLKHIGIYGYKKDFLIKYINLRYKNLETQESLEQLRVLENGYKILVSKIEKDLVGVDTEEDLKRVEKILSKTLNYE